VAADPSKHNRLNDEYNPSTATGNLWEVRNGGQAVSKNGYFDDTRAAARKRRRKALFSSLTWAVIGACIAIFLFLYSGDYDPIAREDAASYTLQFDRYEASNSSKRASVIYFTDGSYFYVPLSVESDGFLNSMKSKPQGMTLFVLVNPRNNCVIELKTKTSELLNFEETQRQIAAEVIREKILRTLDKEIPHGVAVVIEEYRDEGGLVRIRAEIFCEKASHKGILVGKNGETLKRIGSYAREDLEKMLEAQVYLNLWVKVKENWRDSQRGILNFGYTED
jgi:hypothetical protein